MKNNQASARTADAVQFMQLRVAAKDVVQLVEYMLQHGEWYLAEERIERLRNALEGSVLEGSVCPACGSDRNERDELDKAEREIERLRSAPATLQQAEPVAWMRPTRDSCYLRSAETMLAIHEDCDGIVRTGWKPLYLHPPADEVQRLRDAAKKVIDAYAELYTCPEEIIDLRRALEGLDKP